MLKATKYVFEMFWMIDSSEVNPGLSRGIGYTFLLPLWQGSLLGLRNIIFQ